MIEDFVLLCFWAQIPEDLILLLLLEALEFSKSASCMIRKFSCDLFTWKEIMDVACFLVIAKHSTSREKLFVFVEKHRRVCQTIKHVVLLFMTC